MTSSPTYHVICDRRGRVVATVLSMDGVKVPRGGSVDVAAGPAPAGHRWCPVRKGYHRHEDEAAHHAHAACDPDEIAELKARIAALEARLSDSPDAATRRSAHDG